MLICHLLPRRFSLLSFPTCHKASRFSKKGETRGLSRVCLLVSSCTPGPCRDLFSHYPTPNKGCCPRPRSQQNPCPAKRGRLCMLVLCAVAVINPAATPHPPTKRYKRTSQHKDGPGPAPPSATCSSDTGLRARVFSRPPRPPLIPSLPSMSPSPVSWHRSLRVKPSAARSWGLLDSIGFGLHGFLADGGVFTRSMSLPRCYWNRSLRDQPSRQIVGYYFDSSFGVQWLSCDPDKKYNDNRHGFAYIFLSLLGVAAL